MRSVYVFPGQGSQHKGMGAGLFEKFPELVAQADDVLGYSIEDLCLRDPDRVLNQTQYTQPALYVVSSLTYLDRTTERGELPAVVAGHSLGEYCALFAAGAFDFATGLRLVAKRGELMSQAPKGTDPVFRRIMDRCDAAHRAAGGTSLVDAVHDDSRRGQPLDDILTSHAALYSIGYSLTEMLRAEGVHPDAVLGHSLGEYIAATVAGALSFEDGLRLVTRQARLLQERCPDGGMLSVLDSPDLYRTRRDLFGDIALAAVNYDRNFVVSGADNRLTNLQKALDAEGVIAVRLPVRHAFHSALLDTIRPDCLSLAGDITPGTPRLPVHSSMLAARLGTPQRWDEYLWDVIRRPVRFDELMASEFTAPDRHFFVDLSASGSFANFLKHGYAPAFRGAPAINQFGNNTGTVRKLRDGLLSLRF
jgi:acyl transferase domain-containing protein